MTKNIATTKSSAVQEIHSLMARKCGEAYSPIKVGAQINSFVKQGYAIEDIRDTIVWWFGVRNEDASKANGGIGIFPYIYADFLKYKQSIINNAKINKDKNIEDYVDDIPLNVSIKPTPIKRPKIKLFNFE